MKTVLNRRQVVGVEGVQTRQEDFGPLSQLTYEYIHVAWPLPRHVGEPIVPGACASCLIRAIPISRSVGICRGKHGSG